MEIVWKYFANSAQRNIYKYFTKNDRLRVCQRIRD